MIFISYNLGCRNCLQGDATRHMTSITDASFEDYVNKTEFEVVSMIEQWRNNDNMTCDYCGSHSVEVLDIEVSHNPLYNYDDLVEKCTENGDYMIMFNLDKTGNNIKLTPGGSQQIDTNFAKAAFSEIFSTILRKPEHYFIPQIKGNFFLCLTGNFNFMDGHSNVQIERFRTAGLTREEIMTALKPFADQIGVDIPNVASNSASPKSFKGSLFNSWFYAESLEEAEKGGYSYSNACFDLDENTIVAHGTAHDESPRDFIDNNQHNEFIIDETKPSIKKGNKTVVFAKKI